MNIAFVIPCYNEELTIAATVKDCLKFFPTSIVYVVDNNSTDQTATVAQKAGASVIFEFHKGKGNAVKRAFMSVDADIYIILDGDGTYDVSISPQMVNLLITNKLDMVIGIRQGETDNAYRQGHRFGNWLFNKILKILFKSNFTDIFSGYRVMSRTFVKSLPLQSKGFDIETEISLHALEMRLPTLEIKTTYKERIIGSVSKLSTYKDSFKILTKIIKLFSEIHPFKFYGLIALVLFLLCLSTGVPVILDFIQTGIVPRFPTAILASALGVMAVVTFFSGLIIHYVYRLRIENKILLYNIIGKLAIS